MIEYLREENRVIKEQMTGRALRLNDDHRRRLAAKAKALDRRVLERVATIVTDTQPLCHGEGVWFETGDQPPVADTTSSGQSMMASQHARGSHRAH